MIQPPKQLAKLWIAIPTSSDYNKGYALELSGTLISAGAAAGGRFCFWFPLLGGAGPVAIVEGAGGGGGFKCAAIDARVAWLADDSRSRPP